MTMMMMKLMMIPEIDRNTNHYVDIYNWVYAAPISVYKDMTTPCFCDNTVTHIGRVRPLSVQLVQSH